MTEYFYRKIGSPDFEFSAQPKVILPVWLPNKFYPQALYYNNAIGKVEAYDGNYNAFVAANQNLLPVEVVRTPFLPKLSIVSYDPLRQYENNSEICIEDFDFKQMSAYLEHRYARQRYEFDRANLKDENKLSKAVFGLYQETNIENLTFRIHVQTLFGKDLQYDYYLLFDLQKGKVLSYSYDNLTREKWKYSKESYHFFNMYLKGFQERYIPQNLTDHIFYSFLKIVSSFTNISYERLCQRYRNSPNKRCLFEMYRLTMLPYEPGLWTVLNNPNLKTRLKSFDYTRSDSSIFKKVCSYLEIRNTRTLRRIFARRPNIIVVFVNLKDCGFTDINLYNRVIEDEEFCKVFQSIDESITFFTRYCIERRGEKATLNILFKGANDMSFTDALDMFYRYFYKLPESLIKDILYDGFTRVNHDVLAEISYQCQHKNKVFKYSLAQQTLCDSISGYDFILPKDSYQLCEIGCSLHNCVASYDESILKKQCTIVCAKKEGKYKICIELWGKNIIQELGDKNKMPSEEEKKILDEWHLRHNLIPN